MNHYTVWHGEGQGVVEDIYTSAPMCEMYKMFPDAYEIKLVSDDWCDETNIYVKNPDGVGCYRFNSKKEAKAFKDKWKSFNKK